MKKLYILAVLMPVILFSCKKSVSSSGGDKPPIPPATSNISATVDGALVNFTTKVSASAGTTMGHSLSIRGYSNNGTMPDEVLITIDSKTPIVPGTYTRSFAGQDDLSAGIEYMQPGGLEYNTANNTDVKNANQFIIVITSITADKVEGIFSGLLVSTCHVDSHEKLLENGRFSASLAQQ